jgi:hypothetical protein
VLCFSAKSRRFLLGNDNAGRWQAGRVVSLVLFLLTAQQLYLLHDQPIASSSTSITTKNSPTTVLCTTVLYSTSVAHAPLIATSTRGRLEVTTPRCWSICFWLVLVLFSRLFLLARIAKRDSPAAVGRLLDCGTDGGT